ncbi:MAG: hypothetical protein LBT81_00980 [Helicobacteraceae bacterium]|nr:hypothetical protein [Helicobacteraceae bacterium]
MKVLYCICVLALSLYADPFSGDENCKDIVFEGEEYYSTGYECFYPKLTIAQVYADFRADKIKDDSDDPGYKNLRATLEIGKNYEYGSLDKKEVEIQRVGERQNAERRYELRGRNNARQVRARE